MSELVVPAPIPSPTARSSSSRPSPAGWQHVGFEALALAPGQTAERDTGDRECCVVVVGGHVHVRSEHGDWRDLGGARRRRSRGAPDAAYLPPGTRVHGRGRGDGGEVGLCFAPAARRRRARACSPRAASTPETRGHGAHERTVHPILMGDEAADALLVCEVQTPPGHWSSYPPHKHDRDAMPEESLLEETYYFRIDPPQGFGAAARLHRRPRRSTRRSRSATATPCSCRAATTRSPRRPATPSTTST